MLQHLQLMLMHCTHVFVDPVGVAGTKERGDEEPEAQADITETSNTG